MPQLIITNNTLVESGIQDPETLFFKTIPAGQSTFVVSDATLWNLKDQLADLATRIDDAGDPKFTIAITAAAADGFEDGSVSDLVEWLANRVTVNGVVSNPSTGSVVGARRVNVAALEAFVDGSFFTAAASTDDTGDAELDVDGVDVSGDDLAADESVYMAVVLVNNAGTLETVFVRGASVDNTGSLVPDVVTDAEVAAAVGVYLGEDGPAYEFVRVANVLFEESSGLTQTTTSLRPAPPTYL